MNLQTTLNKNYHNNKFLTGVTTATAATTTIATMTMVATAQFMISFTTTTNINNIKTTTSVSYIALFVLGKKQI